MTSGWTLDDIPWNRFDPAKVDAELLRAVKAAALVEMNSPDYVDYLLKVFHDDPDFQAEARRWGVEERQHGEALGRWAEMADPGFDFADAFRRFREGYRINPGDAGSVRGGRACELIARCVVESGTSSYYTAIRDATEEPALKAIAARIAADEFRHYKLFYDALPKWLERERPSRLRRLATALGRLKEAEDDELAMAYYCANAAPGAAYDVKTFARAYGQRAAALYRRRHIDRAAAMIAKAAQFNPKGLLPRALAALVWRALRMRGGGRGEGVPRGDAPAAA